MTASLTKPLYTARATATGGRAWHARVSPRGWAEST
jgi:hypothetical protein